MIYKMTDGDGILSFMVWEGEVKSENEHAKNS